MTTPIAHQKTVEQVRKLVEQDGVLLVASPLGTPTNSAIWHYMKQNKVTQLFVSTGATKWDDPKHFPWTTGWQPNYQSEGRVYAAYILEHKPDGKIGVLYQNDDFGKDYVKGSQRWPWRRGPIDDRRRRSLRDDGPHGRFAGDRHEGRRRRCLGQYRHPEIRRSGDPQGGYAPSVPQTLVQVLKQCDDNPTRENIMKKAANLHDFSVPMLLPGNTINTSPTDFAPIKQIQMAPSTASNGGYLAN